MSNRNVLEVMSAQVNTHRCRGILWYCSFDFLMWIGILKLDNFNYHACIKGNDFANVTWLVFGLDGKTWVHLSLKRMLQLQQQVCRDMDRKGNYSRHNVFGCYWKFSSTTLPPHCAGASTEHHLQQGTSSPTGQYVLLPLSSKRAFIYIFLSCLAMVKVESRAPYMFFWKSTSLPWKWKLFIELLISSLNSR